MAKNETLSKTTSGVGTAATVGSGAGLAERFYLVAGYIRGVASELSIPIRQGVDWDGDFQIRDQTFHDLGHTELLGKGT